jgi:hypothetical protein
MPWLRAIIVLNGCTYISGPCRIELDDNGGANDFGYVQITTYIDAEETEEDRTLGWERTTGGTSVGTGFWNQASGRTHAHGHLGR